MMAQLLFRRISAAVLGFGFVSSVWAQGVELYPTGPAEDAAFVRFVDGGFGAMRVAASGSKAVVQLSEQDRSTRFFPVKAGASIAGEASVGAMRKEVALKAKPGEFLTVVGVADKAGALSLLTLREQPEDFSAVKASIAFYNMNAQCGKASVEVAGRKVFVFDAVSHGGMARRVINPVKLTVQLLCEGQRVGAPLDMQSLAGGERYSLFLTPGDPAERFFFVIDTVAN